MSLRVLRLDRGTASVSGWREAIGEMWRSLFLAVGITLIIIGAECLVIDSALVTGEGGPKHFKPPEWAPWSMISTGSIIILYSFTIPKRMNA